MINMLTNCPRELQCAIYQIYCHSCFTHTGSRGQRLSPSAISDSLLLSSIRGASTPLLVHRLYIRSLTVVGCVCYADNHDTYQFISIQFTSIVYLHNAVLHPIKQLKYGSFIYYWIYPYLLVVSSPKLECLALCAIFGDSTTSSYGIIRHYTWNHTVTII